jgi:hypothetical protein
MQERSHLEELEAGRRRAIAVFLVFVVTVVLAVFALGLVPSLNRLFDGVHRANGATGGSLLTPCPGSTPTELEAVGGRAVIRCANGSVVEGTGVNP